MPDWLSVATAPTTWLATVWTTPRFGRNAGRAGTRALVAAAAGALFLYHGLRAVDVSADRPVWLH